MAVYKFVSILSFLLLASCSSPVVIGCPSVKQWNRTEQYQMLIEINSLPDPSMLVEAMKDYHRMRVAATACENAR